MMKNALRMVIAAIAVFGLTAACYAEKVVVEGSTTVLPIAQAAAEQYMGNNPQADITVRGGGSGVGIASFIDKTCDIADSSRAIKDTEVEKAIANGVDPKAHVVAMDGFAVIVNSSNPVSALTKKQIKDIYTGAISNWSQLGGPDEKIVVISRDSSSGTFEAFGTLALDGAKVRPDALLQASNQAVAQTVSRTPGAVGYAGLGFIAEGTKAVTVNGIMPDKETVLLGTYLLSRPLFMYTNGEPKGMLKDFVDFIKSPQGQKIAEEQGFVGLQ
jgi:phosphate transport system substrate-binding protein